MLIPVINVKPAEVPDTPKKVGSKRHTCISPPLTVGTKAASQPGTAPQTISVPTTSSARAALSPPNKPDSLALDLDNTAQPHFAEPSLPRPWQLAFTASTPSPARAQTRFPLPPMSTAPWDYIAKLVCIGDSGCGKSSLTIRLCEGRFSPHHDVTIGVEFGSRIVPVGPPHTKTLPQPLPAASSSLSPSSPPPEAAGDGSSTKPAAVSADKDTSAAGLPEPPRDTSKTPQKHMKLSLWDTAGQETYKSVTRSYFRGASGALLVFDLSRKQTFQHVTDWLNDLRQIAEPDIVVVLVGNKADLTQQDDNKREVTRDEAEEWARRNGVMEYVETSAKSGENVENAFMRVAERIFHNIQAGKYDLNDRRSGVKGPSAGGSRQVKLASEVGKSVTGGCC